MSHDSTPHTGAAAPHSPFNILHSTLGQRPLSVILPIYNAARYLDDALDSIAAQTHRDYELIALDDGSTDTSLAILRRHAAADSRIRVITRPNTGIVGALNDVIAAAHPKTEYIARMDADDIAHPERFTVQLAHLRAHPHIVALGTAVTLIDTEGAPVKNLSRPLAHSEIEKSLLSGDGGAMIHPTVMIRRSALASTGLYRAEAQYVEDVDLFLRLALVGPLANLPDTLLRYRVHPASINFDPVKNAGRHARLIEVLRQAHAARALPFNPPSAPDASSSHALANLHREWAITSLSFGDRAIALKHARAALRARPLSLQTWRAYRYARTAPIPHS